MYTHWLWTKRSLADVDIMIVRRTSNRPSRIINAAALAFVTAAILATAPMVRADTNCTGTLTGMINGNVTVLKGASCTIELATVTGNVHVSRGANLIVQGYSEPATIGGNVEADHCKSALLEGNVTVGGNLRIHDCTGTESSGFQGPGIKIGGDFNCHNNSGPCIAWLGDVGGDVQIHQNGSSMASDISLVSISGNLDCQQNTQSPTHRHGPDWVTGNLQNQCSADRGFAAKGTSIVSSGRAQGPGMACESLGSLTDFPVPNTTITSEHIARALQGQRHH